MDSANFDPPRASGWWRADSLIETRPAPADHGLRPALFLATLTGVALAIHVFGQSGRPLWLDEACTAWTLEAGPLEILRGTRNDGTPPLYFLLVWGITSVGGSGEVVLRLVSLLAATALVPGLYWATRGFGSPRAALLVAGFAALSPLVHYYAVEARNYALVQLLMLPLLVSLARAVARPDRVRGWLAVGIALAALLYTHNYAAFLLPVIPFVATTLPGPGRRVRALGAALAAAGAFVAYVPWLRIALVGADQGIGAWIRPWWEQTPPWAAIPRSFEVFGFGGRFPVYLGYLGDAPALPVVGVALTLLMLGAAVAATRRPFPDRPLGDPGSPWVPWGLLFGPLLVAWLYSIVREPIYLVGRYDTLALPPFLLLLGLGADAWLVRFPRAGWAVPVIAATLAAASLSPAFGETHVAERANVEAAGVIAAAAKPGDVVVTAGQRYAVVRYYLQRAGADVRVRAFPTQIELHPGWFNTDAALRATPMLEIDGRELARECVEAARRGATIWYLDLPSQPRLNEHFLHPLRRQLRPDAEHSDPALGLVAFVAG